MEVMMRFRECCMLVLLCLSTVLNAQYAYQLRNSAHIDDGGFAAGVAAGHDGIVFLVNGADGLRAYYYNGTSFSNKAHIMV